MDFNLLPDAIKSDLHKANCREFYDLGSPAERLTLLNTYAVMKHHGMWHLVTGCPRSGPAPTPGTMKLMIGDMFQLKNHLTSARDFTNPRWSAIDGMRNLWAAHSKSATNMLHLKGWKGWQDNHIEAHVDPKGLRHLGDILTHRDKKKNPWNDPIKVHESLRADERFIHHVPKFDYAPQFDWARKFREGKVPWKPLR